MTQHFFFNIMRKIIVQSLDIFNDINIARYNSMGEVERYVKVPLQFAPKTKQWYFQQNKRESDGLNILDQVFPKMAMSLTDMEYAQDRMVNNLQKVVVSHDDNSLSEHITPIPYNYHFELQIAAEYMVDITQIMEQILPWFDPFVFIRIQIPELNLRSGHNHDDPNDEGSDALDLKVVYNGASPELTVDKDVSDMRLLMWNFQFEVQGYLFQPVKIEPYIKKIIHDVYTNETNLKDSLSLSMSTSGASADNFLLRDITSSTMPYKYDDDIKIMYEHERIYNDN